MPTGTIGVERRAAVRSAQTREQTSTLVGLLGSPPNGGCWSRPCSSALRISAMTFFFHSRASA